MRVTHPFHPLRGRQFAYAGERQSRYATYVMLHADEERVFAVPRQWTDADVADPEVLLGGGRAPFLTADLIGLAELVEDLAERNGRAEGVK